MPAAEPAKERETVTEEILRAEKGMVVLHVEPHHEWLGGEKCRTYETVSIGIVTAVNRDGTIKKFQIPTARGSWKIEHLDHRCRWRFRGEIILTDAEAGRAEQVARAHHVPGHPEIPMPFRTLDEVDEAYQEAKE